LMYASAIQNRKKVVQRSIKIIMLQTYKKFNPLHTQQLIARFSDITIFLEIDPCGSNPCSNQAT
ncbi:hypothetical protein T4B_6508, partial [Trichinella pseudospiralis]